MTATQSRLFKPIEISLPRLRLVASARLESTCQSNNGRSGVSTKIPIEIRSRIWLESGPSHWVMQTDAFSRYQSSTNGHILGV